VITPVLVYPGVKSLIDLDTIQDTKLRDAFLQRLSH
jgi:hypothetical protein